MTVLSDAPFYWPLRGSIALQNGSGTPTFTRATAKWMFNDEGKLIKLPSGAIEMRGYRPVINWFVDPNNIAGSADWLVNNVSKAAVLGPDGSASDGCLVTCTANNSNYIRQTYASVDISLTVTPVLGVSAMIANIPDTAGISTPGIYTLRVTFVDSDGNIRGLTPDPEYLIFYE